MLVREFIKSILLESSRSRRAHIKSLTGGRLNTKLEMWKLADSLITDPPTAFFTMTNIQKVGLNPSSDFKTPLGIYSYPVTEETVDQLLGVFIPEENNSIESQPSTSADTLSEAGNYGVLPFVSDAPYITFFRLDPGGVFYTSSGMDSQTFSDAVSKLESFAKRYTSGWFSIISAAWADAVAFHKKDQTGGSNIYNLSLIWTMTRSVSLSLTSKFPDNATSKSMILWRKILIELGINAIVDDAGSALIHPSEPTQAAIFDMSIVEIIQQFENSTEPATGLPGRKRADSLDKTRISTKELSSYVKKYLTITEEDAEKIAEIESRAKLGQNTVDFDNITAFKDIFYKLEVLEKKSGNRVDILDTMLKDSISQILESSSDNIKDKLNILLQLAKSRAKLDSSSNSIISNGLLAVIKKLKPAFSSLSNDQRQMLTSPAFDFSIPREGTFNFFSENESLIKAYADIIAEGPAGDNPKDFLQRIIERPHGSMSLIPPVAIELITRLWKSLQLGDGVPFIYKDLSKKEVRLDSLDEAIKKYKNKKISLV